MDLKRDGVDMAETTGIRAVAQARRTAQARTVELAEQLRGALAGAEGHEAPSMLYQPLVSLADGAIVGAEALMRWRDMDGNEVAPVELLDAAEAAGMTAALTGWTIAEACRDAGEWRASVAAPVRLNLNLSLAQCCLPNLRAIVVDAVRASGLPPTALVIEAPEAALADTAPSLATLVQLRKSGVEIAVDNFGTGYSSLGRLRGLPINLVKIDRSFVGDLEARPGQASVTRAVIHLAHGLRMRVLAQGVETRAQLRALLATGCDLMQGWVFSPPVTSVELTRMLREGKSLPIDMTHRREHERTLLLVDDEPNVLSALRRVFRGEGYRIITAANAQEGLAVLKEQPVDVIVSDQRMPVMTGVEFLRQAKVLRPETIRMTLSGYTELQSIIDAVNEGAVFRFLTKPWDDQQLRQHVAEAFQAQSLVNENLRLTRELAAALADLAHTQRRLDAFLDRRLGGEPTTRGEAGHHPVTSSAAPAGSASSPPAAPTDDRHQPAVAPG